MSQASMSCYGAALWSQPTIQRPPRSRTSSSKTSLIARSAWCPLLIVLALAASFSATAPASASKLDCHLGDPAYNTVLCGISKQRAGQHCAQVAHLLASSPTASYAAGSSRYSIRFNQQDGLIGCNAAGTRTITYFQELRKGPVGPFVRSGKITSRATNAAWQVDDTQTIPYDCSADGAGSAVRAVVRLTWHPKKGWGGNTTSHDHASKPLTIC